MSSLPPERLAQLIETRRVQVIDLRSPGQWRQGHIQGARNIQLDGLATEAMTLDRELPVVFYGNDGEPAAADVAEALRAAGLTAYSLAGGLDEWIASGQSVETGE